MCESTSPVRNSEISHMMDYGFANDQPEVMYNSGQVVEKAKALPLVAGDTAGILMMKGDKKETYLKRVF